HPRDVFGRIGGYPHEWRDPGRKRRHADLAGGFDRGAAVLHVHIDGIEARGLGNLGDLTLTDQPDRHGCDHLAAGELLLDVVAQDVADRHVRSRIAVAHCRGAIAYAVPVTTPVLQGGWSNAIALHVV